jgi:hypothetical protein
MGVFEFGGHDGRKGGSLAMAEKKKSRDDGRPGLRKDLAATYSRGSYTTTTIGKTAFDGRVRDGNGSDHSFIATKKSSRFQKNVLEGTPGIFAENYT